MGKNKTRAQIERYELNRSPFAQKPTQKEVAALLGETRDDLRRIINYKEQFVLRRTENIRGKNRNLVYPVARFRAVHERLKFHLNKVRQPSYLFSPRRNRGQRDNAKEHIDQYQYLTLDLKQFYPSTTAAMVRDFFSKEMKMYPDVAGLLTHICTIDDRVSFGSPLTPVLCTLVHRKMFDAIASVCDELGLKYSVWVDDLTISGNFIPGKVIVRIRQIVRCHGLRAHKISYQTGNRPVFITGIGIVGKKLIAPNSLNLRLKCYWEDLHGAQTPEEKDSCTQNLLSQLGTVRHITGPDSETGRKAANQMNALRQKRNKMYRMNNELRKINTTQVESLNSNLEPEELPF